MKVFMGLITILLMIFFILYPSVQISGAIKGILVCGEIIIPSLFPFTVLALFLFNCGFIKSLEKIINPFSNKIFKLSGRNFAIFIISFIGGFPVGARLIEEEYKACNIDKKLGENMLAYCVNSGPAFIIIGIGNKIFGCKLIGIMLFLANLTASFIIAFFLRFFNSKTFIMAENDKEKTPLSDAFVKSTANASTSIIGICSFVILFSTLIEIIKALPLNNAVKNLISSLLEITNGTIICGKNIYIIAFLLGFSGFCVHFQILSVTKVLKPNYLKFLTFRIIHGILTAIILIIFLKIHPIYLQTINGNVVFWGTISSISIPFSASLIILCAVFLESLRKI